MNMATTATSWVTPLHAALTQAGVATPDADVLTQSYPDADPALFVSGLDWLAQLYLTTQVPNLAPPTIEPWSTIAATLTTASPGDYDLVFAQTIAVEPPELQAALSNALLSRSQTLQTQQQPVKKKRAKSAEYLKALDDLGYTFRMNTLNDMVEVSINGAWQNLSDPIAAKIRRQMRDKGWDSIEVMEDTYISEAYDQRYHPVHGYLDGLQYDGGQHIAALSNHFVDKDGVFAIFLRRWLIGAVAKARKAEQNRVLVLDGIQKLGKSFFAAWIGEVVEQCYIEAPINPDDKDNQIRLASKWIWEISEFGNTTRKADREALKFFLTQKTVTVRKAYGRFDMVKPALANFIGTFNNETGVLNDPTGNRRFMIANLTRIDWSYSQTVDKHQVWAEANAAYLNGEPWDLTPDETTIANSVNERYEIDDPMEGLLKQYYLIEPNNPLAWTPTHEILTTLETNGLRGGSTRQHSMYLASIMTKLGCERVRRTLKNGGRVWCYQGVTPV